MTNYNKHFLRLGNADPRSQIDEFSLLADHERPWMRNLPKDARILDCGCGFGHFLYALDRLGFHCLEGVERDPDACRIAREALGDRASIREADAFVHLGENPCRFDLIICQDVLEHFTPDQGERLLLAIFRALRPGGLLHLRVPNMSSLLAGYSRYLDITHLNGFTEYSLAQLCDQCGFTGHELLPEHPRLVCAPAWPLRMVKRVARFLVYAVNHLLHRALYALRLQQPIPTRFGMNIELVTRKPEAG
ncbi:MAG TPA: class I SAM-dependent methyltransferase [Candidatus Ozemobacteraceae bacterium]|nr:class I SAM-dependent methyltransferase [Candidatus Ozemobacteraceae bacterium]